MKPPRRHYFVLALVIDLVACSSGSVSIPPATQAEHLGQPQDAESRASWSITKIAGLYAPSGIAHDLSGNIYVASAQRGILVKIDAAGNKKTIARNLGTPGGVALYGGYVYVTDSLRSQVLKISQGGRVTPIGSGWGSPQGIAIDRSGNIYVSDTGFDTVFKLSNDGTIKRIRCCFDFRAPYGVAVDNSGDVYVTSQGRNAVYKVPPHGAVVPIGTGWDSPFGVALSNSGVIFVANYKAREITEISGSSTMQIPGKLGFGRPYYLTVDAHFNIYVTSPGKNAIYKLSQ